MLTQSPMYEIQDLTTCGECVLGADSAHYIYMCVCVCIHVHIYTERDKKQHFSLHPQINRALAKAQAKVYPQMQTQGPIFGI